MRSDSVLRGSLVSCVAVLALGAGNAAHAATSVSALRAGDLVISEVMIYPSTDETRSEWFEVYNASGAAVDLLGMVISGKSGESQTVTSSVPVAANDYALFAVKNVPATDGGLTGVDYVYTRATNKLDNGIDTLAISYGDLTFDSISWSKTDATFKATLGASLQLDVGRLNARVNSNGAYWCLGATTYGSGGMGTPGTANASCSVPTLSASELVAGDLVVTEVMVAPAAANDAIGEWIEVYNTTGEDINLNGVVLEDDGTDSYTISSDIIAYADEVILLSSSAKYAKNGGLPLPDGIYNRNIFRQDNGADEVVLSYGGTVIDEVTWTKTSFPVTVGYSVSLDPSAWDATSNDSASNWCNATTAYGTASNFGTPQADNDSCF